MAGRSVTIIGGGAAGCFAAIAAAAGGAEVTIIERNRSLGKKLLVTGNGRCNFCHENITPGDYYRPEDDPFLRTLLGRFSPKDCVDTFRAWGITPLNRDGYLYPYSEQARAVAEVLSRRIAYDGVRMMTDTTVTGLERTGNGYRILCGDQTLTADAVILTTGGAAAPETGSDGSGYGFCRALGHRVIPPVPALTPLFLKNHPFVKAAGVRLAATVSVECAGERSVSDTGQVQITKAGLSGIPVFNVSRFATRALAQGTPVSLHLRLVPDMTQEELRGEMSRRLADTRLSPYKAMLGLLPDSFANAFLRFAGIDPDSRIRDSGAFDRILADAASDICLEVSGFGDMSAAQVTCGGVDPDEVDPGTMRSKVADGLYLAGEILDIDGPCGGYNLYFAWASGYVAGTAAGGG